MPVPPELSNRHIDPKTYPAGVAFMDGQYLPMSEAKISVLDYGLLHSDATYDVVHVWEGAFFRLQDHLERFFAGLERLHMSIEYNKVQVTEILHNCVALSGLRRSYVEFICTRGILDDTSGRSRSENLIAIAGIMKYAGLSEDDFAQAIWFRSNDAKDHALDQSNPERALGRAWENSSAEPKPDVNAGAQKLYKIRRDARSAVTEWRNAGVGFTDLTSDEQDEAVRDEARAIQLVEDGRIAEAEADLPHTMTVQEYENEKQVEALRSEARAQAARDSDPQKWMIEDLPSKLLKDIARHTLATQRQETNGLAVAIALAAVSNANANQCVVEWEGPIGLNISSLVVASSGVGKSAGLGVARTATDIGEIAQVGAAKSVEGVQDLMFANQRRGVFVSIEECSSFLSAMAAGATNKGLNNQAALGDFITDALTQAVKRVTTSATVRRGRQQGRPSSMSFPYLTAMFITTPKNIEGRFTDQMVEGGFLGRQLYLRTPSGDIRRITTSHVLPDGIRQGLSRIPNLGLNPIASALRRFLIDEEDPHEERPFVTLREGDIHRQMLAIRMTENQKVRLFENMQVPLIEEFSERSFAARADELAVKVAGLVEIGRMIDNDLDRTELDGPVYMSDEALDYGMKLAEFSVRCISREIGMLVADTERQTVEQIMARMQRGIIRGIAQPETVQKGRYEKDLSQGIISQSFLTYVSKSADVRIRDNAIQTLLELEWITGPFCDSIKGQKRLYYRLGAAATDTD